MSIYTCPKCNQDKQDDDSPCQDGGVCWECCEDEELIEMRTDAIAIGSIAGVLLIMAALLINAGVR